MSEDAALWSRDNLFYHQIFAYFVTSNIFISLWSLALTDASGRKFIYTGKIFNFVKKRTENFIDFWPIVRLLNNILIFEQCLEFWTKFGVLKKIWMFEQNLDFWTKCWFLNKIWSFEQNLDFWTKFGSRFRFFWLKFRFIWKRLFFPNLEAHEFL